MERGWNVIRDREGEGSPRSAELATALAQVADPELLERLLWAVTLLDSVGGELYIGAFRNKYDEQGNRIPKANLRETPGEYETDGYVLRWDSMAEMIRDAQREPNVKGPAEPPAAISEPPVDPIELAEAAERGPVAVPDIPAEDIAEVDHEAEELLQLSIESSIAEDGEGDEEDGAEEADAPDPVSADREELDRVSPLPKDTAFARG